MHSDSLGCLLLGGNEGIRHCFAFSSVGHLVVQPCRYNTRKTAEASHLWVPQVLAPLRDGVWLRALHIQVRGSRVSVNPRRGECCMTD